MLLKRFLQWVFGEKMEHFFIICLATESSGGADPSPVYIDYPVSSHASPHKLRQSLACFEYYLC